MPDPRRPELRPILAEDLVKVGTFLHENLNPRVTADQWRHAATVPWSVVAPNVGFRLVVGDDVVGVHLAFYSERVIDGRVERFCNLGAWCVLEPYRADGLRLLRALLAQRDYTFTDLSPSGNVVTLNDRLGFQRLDTAAVAILARPQGRSGARVSSNPDRVAALLDDTERAIYDAHAATAAALHLVIETRGEHSYVVLRRDRRKHVPGFGSVLYVSNPELWAQGSGPLAWHALRRHGIHTLLAEGRVTGSTGSSGPGIPLPRTRPKMFRSARLASHQIDYLYSELTCVAW